MCCRFVFFEELGCVSNPLWWDKTHDWAVASVMFSYTLKLNSFTCKWSQTNSIHFLKMMIYHNVHKEQHCLGTRLDKHYVVLATKGFKFKIIPPGKTFAFFFKAFHNLSVFSCHGERRRAAVFRWQLSRSESLVHQYLTCGLQMDEDGVSVFECVASLFVFVRHGVKSSLCTSLLFGIYRKQQIKLWSLV